MTLKKGAAKQEQTVALVNKYVEEKGKLTVTKGLSDNATDQDGKKYYMVKNSWGVTGKYDGIWYCTEAFVRAQTLDITVHKDALTKDLKKRLGVK